MRREAPSSLDELLARVADLQGIPLAELADAHHMRTPPDLRRHKGWIGELAEVVLGATSGSLAEPDFPDLGVELKTVPVDHRGFPKESTYVCTAPFDLSHDWERSWVRRKLACVLWLPVQTLPGVPPGERAFGKAKLWRPNVEQSVLLAGDYAMHAEAMALGEWWRTDASRGEVLQLRPKAADSKAGAWVLDAEANWVKAVPLGFYLRTSFTRQVLLASDSPLEGGIHGEFPAVGA